MRERLLFVILYCVYFCFGSAAAADRIRLSLSDAQRGTDVTGQIILLNVRLDDISRSQFAVWTKRHVGSMINLRIDGDVVCRPRLLMELTGGKLQIPGVAAEKIDTVVAALLDGRAALEVDVDE